MTDEKHTLRRTLRTQAAAMDSAEKAAADARLLTRLTAHPWIRQADTVLLYCSVGAEPDTRQLLAWLLSQGVPAALPVCGQGGSMTFYLLHDIAELTQGAYGIPVPSGRECPVLTAHTVCIVPGLAFTADGHRLGQGGGYYDRFLERHPALRTIGLAYGQFLLGSLPSQPHDRCVDTVITDTLEDTHGTE